MFFWANFKIGLRMRKKGKLLRSFSFSPLQSKVIFIVLRFYTSFNSKAIWTIENVDNPSDGRKKEAIIAENFCVAIIICEPKRNFTFFLYSLKSTLHLSHFYLDKLAIIVLIDCCNLWCGFFHLFIQKLTHEKTRKIEKIWRKLFKVQILVNRFKLFDIKKYIRICFQPFKACDDSLGFCEKNLFVVWISSSNFESFK